MGKLIRRTITITIVETWTFVWTPDDGPPGHPVTIVSHPLATEEEANKNLQAALTPTAPNKPSASEPPVIAPTPDTALDLLTGNAPNNAPSHKHKRVRRQRTRSDL